MNLPFFIAKRIYSDQGDKRKVSRPAIRIATIGVAIGLAVMIVTVSVVLGFKHTIRDKVVGFGSHIQVHNILTYSGSDPHPICMDDSLMNVLKNIEGVAHTERFSTTQGILKTDEDFLGVAFKGIGPEYDVHFLKEHLIEGEIPQFSDSTSHYQLLLSKMIADKLKLKMGDKVFAYFIGDGDVRTPKNTLPAWDQDYMCELADDMVKDAQAEELSDGYWKITIVLNDAQCEMTDPKVTPDTPHAHCMGTVQAKDLLTDFGGNGTIYYADLTYKDSAIVAVIDPVSGYLVQLHTSLFIYGDAKMDVKLMSIGNVTASLEKTTFINTYNWTKIA